MTIRGCPTDRSSMIEGASFDPDAAMLCIRFRGGGAYFYFDVPEALFDGLCAAASAGHFFNERIKDRFRHARDPAARRFRPHG